MVSTYTANKGLEQPAHGDYSGNWDVPLNTDMSWIDTAFGGSTNLNATSGSATLTVTQYRSLIINVSGSIGSNVTYTIPSGVGGSWIVNNTATGANIYFVSAAGGSSVQASTGSVTVIYCDGTSIGMKAAGVSPNGSGASGTWNISITGNAATATTASTASYATNAGNAVNATNAINATNATTATTATTASNVAGGYVSALYAGSGISVSANQGAITISSTLAGGTVTAVATGIGLTGGTITTSGTISLVTTYGALGTYASSGTAATPGSSYSGGSVGLPSGTWQCMGSNLSGQWYNGCFTQQYYISTFIRIA